MAKPPSKRPRSRPPRALPTRQQDRNKKDPATPGLFILRSGGDCFVVQRLTPLHILAMTESRPLRVRLSRQISVIASHRPLAVWARGNLGLILGVKADCFVRRQSLRLAMTCNGAQHAAPLPPTNPQTVIPRRRHRTHLNHKLLQPRNPLGQTEPSLNCSGTTDSSAGKHSGSAYGRVRNVKGAQHAAPPCHLVSS